MNRLHIASVHVGAFEHIDLLRIKVSDVEAPCSGKRTPLNGQFGPVCAKSQLDSESEARG